MKLIDCVMECYRTKELVKEFNRLSGTHIGEQSKDPVIRAIDNACGYFFDEEEMRLFIDFVFNYVWLPLCRGDNR